MVIDRRTRAQLIEEVAALHAELVPSPLSDGGVRRVRSRLDRDVLEGIPEAEEARIALKASEARNRALLAAIPDLMLRIGEDGTLLDYFANDSAALAMPPEEFLGRSIYEFFPRDFANNVVTKVAEALATGVRQTLEYQMAVPIDSDDYRDFEARLVPSGPSEVLGIVRDITGRRRAERARQQLAWRLAESKEEQSRLIARELHDEIGQQLTGLKLQIELGTNEAAARALEITKDLIARVNSISLDLRPTVLDDLGLHPALTAQLKRFTALTNVAVDFTARGLDARFDPAVEIAAYRIVQEALTNVARHANVARATLEAVREGDHLRLTVVDGGQGIELDPSDSSLTHGSSGLSGMRERALAIGGDLTITSEPGDGTSIVALLPLHSALRPE